MHTLPAIRYLTAFEGVDFEKIGQLIHQPHWYPPLHNLGLAGWFSVFGVSLLSARSFQTVWWLVLAWSLWRLAQLAAPKDGGIVGAVLVLTGLIADPQLRGLSGTALIEVESTALLTTTIYLASVAWKDGSRRHALLAGLAATWAMGTKYNFGILAGAALALGAGWSVAGSRTAREERAAWLPLVLLSLGPLVVASALWLGLRGHWVSLWEYLHAQQVSANRWSIESLTFYPKHWLFESPATPVAAFGIALSLFQTPRRWRIVLGSSPFLSILLGLAVLVCATLFWKQQKEARFSCMFPPLIWLIAAALTPLEKIPRSARQAIILVLGCCFLVTPPSAVASAQIPNSDAAVGAAYETIARSIQEPTAKVYLLERGSTLGPPRRYWTSGALELRLYEGCRKAARLGCNFTVWDSTWFRARARHAMGQEIRKSDAQANADYVVTMSSIEAEKPPKWLRSWRGSTVKDVSKDQRHPLFVQVWSRETPVAAGQR